MTRRKGSTGLLVIGLLLIPALSPSSAGAVSRSEAIRAYAPLVYFAPEINDGDGEGPKERFLPLSARRFIRASRLRWSHDQGCPDHGIPEADRDRSNYARFAGKLKSGGYEHSTAGALPLCSHNDDNYDTNDRTRPFDGDRPGLGENSSEGFFLELDDDTRPGTGPEAPVYYEFKEEESVTFWFLYAFNFFEGTAGRHEGDWEKISVKLDDNNRAERVAYFQHEGHCTYRWTGTNSVKKYRGHPVVFSARGTHASYRSAGVHDRSPFVPDVTGKGVRWRTYRSLSNVEKQPWYGYGGGWGEVGTVPFSTGPIGPSRYKTGPPSNWDLGCS